MRTRAWTAFTIALSLMAACAEGIDVPRTTASVEGRWLPLPDAPRPGLFPHVSLGGGDSVVSPNGWVLHVPNETWFELEPPPRSGDERQALTWAGDRLFVWGGVRWHGNEAEIVPEAWFWRP